MSSVTRFYFIALGIVVIDQSVKLLVKFRMHLGQEFNVLGQWFKIHFIENPGMAFGLTLNGEYGKLFLTFFSLFAVLLLAVYLSRVARQNRNLALCLSLILGGAVGNIIDRVFYGKFFSYAPFFHGNVVDMFYLDIWKGYLPSWLPFWGNQYTALWPIFNVSDACICIGLFSMLIFQKRMFIEKTQPSINEVNTLPVPPRSPSPSKD